MRNKVVTWQKDARKVYVQQGHTKGQIDATIKQQTCQDCGNRAWGGPLGSWLVFDEAWAAAGFTGYLGGVVCKSCLGKRLVTRLDLKVKKGAGFLVIINAAFKQLNESAETNLPSRG